MPDRLVDAAGWLSRHYPGESPSRDNLRQWHELRAKVFAHIAETDRDHHHEAVALAGIERRHAELISAGTGEGIRPPARPGASHSQHETGCGDTDSTSE